MNANTRLRLWKEARALLPTWAAMAALIALPFLLRAEQPMSFAIAAYWFGCALLGPVIVGQEFQHRTLGLLLSQPVSRRRLWWEKMAVLGAAMVGLFAWMELLWGTEVAQVPVFAVDEETLLKSLVLLFLPLLVGFSSGPALTLVARSAIGGVALTFMWPWFLFMVGIVLVPGYWLSHAGGPALELNGWLIAVGLYCSVLFLFGCRRFHRLEDIHLRGQELTLPTALSKSFAGFTGRFALGQGSALGHLVRKELRLHLPAFVVAGMFVGLWLLLLAVVSARPPVSKEFLLLPAVWLGLGIPVIAGIVSTAEERSLGLLDWHLTLPISARRQWFIKVLVALGVNVVLGILLPGVLAQAADGLLEGKHLELGSHNGEQHFLIANAVIFCAALYASTASANSMRALLGTIVLFLAGAMVLNFADYLAASYPNEHDIYKAGAVYSPPPDYLRPIHGHRWLLGWSCLAVWLYFLGFAGFRRTLESFWQPVRRMAVFFAVVCAFVFAAIDW